MNIKKEGKKYWERCKNLINQISFQFTRAAEDKNAENLLVIKSLDLAGLYVDNWIKHKGHSETYKARY